MAEVDGCVTPAAGPIAAESAPRKEEQIAMKEVTNVQKAQVGKAAPDFEAPAYIAGEGFKNVKLSDYAGQWVVICFYPGDFTFV